MLKRILFGLLVAFIISKSNDFEFKPDEPIAGKIFEISFPCEEEKEGLKGMFIFHLMDTTLVEVRELKREQGKWKAVIEIPEATKFLEFKFETDSGFVIDDEGDYFAKPIFKNPDTLCLHSYYLWAISFLKRGKPKRESVKELLNTELFFYPYNWTAQLLLWRLEVEENPLLIPQVRFKVDSLLKNAKDSLEMLKFEAAISFLEYLNMEERGEALLRDCAKQYPWSNYWNRYKNKLLVYILKRKRDVWFEKEIMPFLKGQAKETAYYLLMSEALKRRDAKRLEQIAKSLLLEFPQSTYAETAILLYLKHKYPEEDSNWARELEGWINKYPDSPSLLLKLTKYYRTRNWDYTLKIYKKLANLKPTPKFLNTIAYACAEEGKALKEAEEWIKIGIDSLSIDHYRIKYYWLSWEERNQERKEELAKLYNTYAWIKFKSKDFTAASNLISKATSFLKSSHTFNEDIWQHAKAIARQTSNEAMELEALLNIWLFSTHSEKIKKELENLYEKKYGSTKRFEPWLADKTTQTLEEYKINKKAPDFKIIELDGSALTLEELKGKVVVLNFWATWCPSCKKEIPWLNKLVERFEEDPNVVFLAISTEKPEEIKKFTRDNPLFYKLYVGSDEIFRAYNIRSIPTHLIIDKKGFIQFKHIGALPNIRILERKIQILK